MAAWDRSVLALGSARMADGVANSFLVIVLPLYVASADVGGDLLGLPEAALTGVILAAYGIFNAAAQPLAGRLSDRLQRRKAFVITGLFLLAGLHLVYAFARTYWALLAIRIGQGLAVALVITASVALVNEVSTRESRGGNMGIYNALRLTGFGTGPLMAGFVVSGGPYDVPWLGRLSGFEATFALASLAAATSALLVLWLVRDPERITREVGAFRIAVRDREGTGLDPIFTLGVASFVMAACVAMLSAIEPQVNARLGQGPRWFGVQFAVFILTMAVAQPWIGKASDRWGRRSFVLWGLVTLVPTTLAQGLAATPWQMVAVRLAQGLSGALVFAPALALAGDLARKGESGLQLSVLTMAFVLGLSLGQLSSGFLVAFGYLAPFAFGAALAVAAAELVRRHVPDMPGA